MRAHRRYRSRTTNLGCVGSISGGVYGFCPRIAVWPHLFLAGHVAGQEGPSRAPCPLLRGPCGEHFLEVDLHLVGLGAPPPPVACEAMHDETLDSWLPVLGRAVGSQKRNTLRMVTTVLPEHDLHTCPRYSHSQIISTRTALKQAWGLVPSPVPVGPAFPPRTDGREGRIRSWIVGEYEGEAGITGPAATHSASGDACGE